ERVAMGAEFKESTVRIENPTQQQNKQQSYQRASCRYAPEGGQTIYRTLQCPHRRFGRRTRDWSRYQVIRFQVIRWPNQVGERVGVRPSSGAATLEFRIVRKNSPLQTNRCLLRPGTGTLRGICGRL